MKVFIENEAGSLIKHIYNEKTLAPAGTMRVSRAYPFPYGFVLHTTSEDGDNVDCFVLTSIPLRRGETVECDPVALMEQVEDGEIDHKVLAALPGHTMELDDRVKLLLIEFATHVFEHVPGKTMEVGGFGGRAAALDYVERNQDGLDPASK
jgi:inorganic pyrophosphatase